MGLFSFFKRKEGAFSHLTQEQFDNLLSTGQLEKFYLIDTRFGGSEFNDNIIYVTKEAAEIKKQFDDDLENYINMGRKVKGYMCLPSYKGKSRIPTSISIQANVDNELFRRDIRVW